MTISYDSYALVTEVARRIADEAKADKDMPPSIAEAVEKEVFRLRDLAQKMYDKEHPLFNWNSAYFREYLRKARAV